MICDPFKGLSDLQLGDEKGTLNHQVCLFSSLCGEMIQFVEHIFFRWRWNHQLDDVRKNDADFIDDKPSQNGYKKYIDGWCVNKQGLI